MRRKRKKIDLKKIPVYEHLDVSLRMTYAQRLQWLQEAQEFVRMVERKRNDPRKVNYGRASGIDKKVKNEEKW